MGGTLSDTVTNANTPLKVRILEEIRENGPIPFDAFMEKALYDSEHGYYQQSPHIFGTKGDFTTAPMLSSLFSESLAVFCADLFPKIPNADILEVGAGTGRMAADLLGALAKKDALPNHYYILEISDSLKTMQYKTIAAAMPNYIDRVIWLDHPPAHSISGVIIGNEVLDAMPVHRFRSGEVIQEAFVGEHNGDLTWHYQPVHHPGLKQYIASLELDLPSGYCSEVNLNIPGFLESLSDSLSQGAVLLIDYGYPRHEYYHPDRSQGTLVCHYQHQAHDDPFAKVGEQDITAFVDFTAVAEAAADVGFEISGFTHQAGFLLNSGIVNIIDTIEDDWQRLQATTQIKQLVMPNAMGEKFKVMALTKHYDDALFGFKQFNQLERL